MFSFKPGPFECVSTPLDFTIPASSPLVQQPRGPVPVVPPADMNLWQKFLFVLRTILLWIIEWLDRLLGL